MKIIIDECLPKRMLQFFPNDQAYTVPQIGLNGVSDSELLNILEEKKIDVFVTIDGNIEYQQQFHNRVFGTVIIRSPSNRYLDLLSLKEKIVDSTKNVSPGEIKHIS